jgi:hypothetical protein
MQWYRVSLLPVSGRHWGVVLGSFTGLPVRGPSLTWFWYVLVTSVVIDMVHPSCSELLQPGQWSPRGWGVMSADLRDPPANGLGRSKTSGARQENPYHWFMVILGLIIGFTRRWKCRNIRQQMWMEQATAWRIRLPNAMLSRCQFHCDSREIHNGMVSIHLPMTYELMNHTCSPITIGIAFDITTAVPDFPGRHPLTAGAQRPLHAARGVQLNGDPWVVDGQNW